MNDEPATDNKIPLLLLGTNSRFNKRLAPFWPQWGLQAMMIDDGEKARSFLQTFSLELVLVDMVWSRNDDHVTLEMLKQLTGSMTTSVLALIHHNESTDHIRQAVATGVDDFFVMAGNLALLENRIRILLETARSKRMMAAQEDRFNAILQRAADGNITTDGSGIILAINNGAARIFACNEQEIIGDEADRLIPGIAKYLHTMVDSEETGNGYGTEGSGVRKDGFRLPLHYSVVRIRVDREVRYSIIIRDLSALKEVENDYRRLAKVLEYNPSMVMITSPLGIIEYVNLKLTEVTGYPAEELVGKDQKILKSGAQDREFNETLWNTIQQGQVWRGEIQNRKRDGSLYWAWVNISPIRSPDGSIQQYVATSRDISAEKAMAEQMAKAQRERQEAQAQMEAILNNMSSIVFLKNYQGRYLFINRSFETFLGRQAQDVLGKQAHDLFGPTLANVMEEADREVLDRKAPVETEITMTGADGERVFFMTKFPLAIGDNPTTVLCGIATDISKRKRMERELQVAKEQAEAANRAKSDFLANMSHEVRTPMNGVVGMLELLDRTELDANQRHFLSTAIKSAELQLAVINDILDFSKIEAGRLELEEMPFVLNEVVEETAAMLADRAHGKGLELAVYIQPELPTRLTGDSLRLRQILINLIANAIKFTETGEVVVEVKRDMPRQDEAIRVGFRISDTGIGMDENVREKIFQPFTQADGSTTRKYGGTGLGLVISRQLVEAMGGDITVESIPGMGSTFHFSIPFIDIDHDREGAVESLRGAYVLIVDDNETNRIILENYFKSWCIPFRSVESGPLALAALRRQKDPRNRRAAFRVAIIDFHMPEMDGLELARSIRHDPDIPPVQIMLFSSGMQPPRDVLRAAGIDLCIMKPAGKTKILDGLAALIKTQKHLVKEKKLQEGKPVGQSAHYRGRVLLVEDTVINQQVAMGMLKQLGLEVTLATNGAEAVEKVKNGDFDLVLMDVQMPIMDGLEASRAVRSMEAASEKTSLPIIAMTAHALEEDRRRCLEAGMDDHLPKPVRWDMLERMLTRWLGDIIWNESKPGEQEIPPPLPRAESTKDEPNHLDTKALASMAMIFKNDPEQVQRLIQEYLSAVPRHLDTMTSELAKHGYDKVTRAAHSLKSQSGYAGVPILAKLGSDLESLKNDPDREERMRLIIQHMQTLWPDIKKSLESWVESYRENA
ncbi:MAG: PAS domain S-box protein [Magnetococcales bacterium]|nr:PAS domain S-box protein [Magnetococcales bacterium]